MQVPEFSNCATSEVTLALEEESAGGPIQVPKNAFQKDRKFGGRKHPELISWPVIVTHQGGVTA